ncbi:MAG: DUF3300 domain-containing protein [Phycisphaeraceae bacterium]|nr:DUF3300 domain-containing protein [Phycisphaeraceae bacterium]
MRQSLVQLFLLGLALTAGTAAGMTRQPSTPPGAVGGAKPQVPQSTLSDADLEEMLAPIALYPDPLLANVLAASVYPDQVKAAGDLVNSGGDDAKIEATDWEPSVKMVAAVPEVIKMMNQYMDWTKALGEAYVVQSSDVMAAVQKLRARAQANGALKSTPQQTVVTSGDTIIIQPAQPNVIYVPTYNPTVVYAAPSSSSVVAAGVIGFGMGVAVGAIIANNSCGCNWHGGYVCWGGGWGGSHYSNVNINRNVNINNNNININNRNTNVNAVTREGARWQPNTQRMNPALAQGQTPNLSNYRNAGAGGAAASIPNRQPGAAPIASRPAPRPSTTSAARPSPGASSISKPSSMPTARPSSMTTSRPTSMPSSRPSSASPSSRPAIPPTRSSMGSTPSSSRPSAFSTGGGGGGRAAAAQRGSFSRGGGGRGRR